MSSHSSLVRPLLALLLAITAGCSFQRGEPVASGTPIAGASESIWLDQNWSAESLDIFSHRGLGATFLPYDWFFVLGRGGEPLASPSLLRSFGFVVDAPTDTNPDGLPVGLGRTWDTKEKQAFVGLNCAACHVGELRVGDSTVRIAGGQALSDVVGLLGAFRDAVSETVEDPARVAAAADALTERGAATDATELSEALNAWLSERNLALDLATPSAPAGPGRIDAMGIILNLVLVVESGIEGARSSTDAAVSYPAIWDANRYDANFSGAHSGTRDELAAAVNVAQILGSFPRLDVDAPGSGASGYSSSVDLPALADLQARAKWLDPPAWPPSFPPVDAGLVERGRDLYAQSCVSCHPLVSELARSAPVRVTQIPVDEIGTDPLATVHFDEHTVPTGPFEGRRLQFLEGPRLSAAERPLAVLSHVVAGVMVNRGGAALAAIDKSRTPKLPAPPPRLPLSYMARPLRGVWATAPYLHNGSVPSLHHLLLPPDQRPEVFHFGDGLFDPERVGFTAGPADGRFRFDTSLPGNSSGGHVFGTDLEEDDRAALVEYLKTL